MGLPTRKFLIIIGTRPEFIKLYPLIIALGDASMEALVVLTGQHPDLLGSLGDLPEEITVYCRLPPLPATGSMNGRFARLLENFESGIILPAGCREVIVQGDTLSAFAGALWAFNNGLRVTHVEAGLRTYDLAVPYPEEGYRQMISRLADFHAAPTVLAASNLAREGISSSQIAVTGNTVVDNVKSFLSKQTHCNDIDKFLDNLNASSPFALLTLHRRENFGRYHKELLQVVIDLLNANSEFSIIFPVHPNPKVFEQLNKLKIPENLHVVDPLPYFSFLGLMAKSKFVVSDSGGIQEECLAMSKRLLIARSKTERPEVLSSSLITLLSSSQTEMRARLQDCVNEPHSPCRFVKTEIGDGCASEKIVTELIKNCD